MMPASMMAAVIKMKSDCKRKDAMKVVRRRGPRSRLKREKKKDPNTKQVMEVSDLAHP